MPLCLRQQNGRETSATLLSFAQIPVQGCAVGDPVQQHIFNPFNLDASGNRQDFTVPNVIDSNLIDPIGENDHKHVPPANDRQRGPGNTQLSQGHPKY